MKSGIEVTRASAVPYGTSFYWGSFPGTMCLANFRGRFATLPNEGRETAATGQWMAGKRMQVGKGGRGLGKWTGFSRFENTLTRLFPHNSTQVVDFPLLSRLSVSWLRVERGGGQWTVDNWQWIANKGNGSNRTNGTNLETERSLMFAYVRVKSLMFAYLEKKYFFPAWWWCAAGGWKSVKFFMVFHSISRFITEIRPVITRFSRF